MTLVGNLLGQLSDHVSFIVDRSLFVFGTLFNCNFWIVRSLLGVLAFVGRVAVDVLVTLLAGVVQGLEDFKCFLWDLLDIGMALLDNLAAFLLAVWYGASTGVQWTAALLVSCALWATTTVTWLASCALALAQLLERAVALLWQGTLALLSLFPRLLVSYWMSLWGLVASIADKLSRGHEALRRAGRRALLGLCNAPRDAYLGLVLLALTWYLFKHFDLFRLIQVNVAKTPALLKHLGSLMRRRLTRRSAPTTEEIPEVPGPDEEPRTRRVSGDPALRRAKRSAAGEECGDLDAVLRLRKEVEQLQEMSQCVVCQERSRCVTLLPCRHLCMCQPCTSRILDTKPLCPICRMYVEEVLKVYT